jgi:hypothetical protein
MAPEQKEHGSGDNRADIYSLGVVLYELLTGELPAGRLEKPLAEVKIDEPLHDLVRRALHENPEMRFQTAADMRDHLETILIAPERARPPRRNTDVDRLGERIMEHPPLLPRRIAPWQLLLGAGIVLAGAALLFFDFSPEPQEPVLPAIAEAVDFNSGTLEDAFFVNVQSVSNPYTLLPGIGLGASQGVAHHNADVSKDATLVYKAKGFDLSTLDSLEVSCFVRRRSLATAPGTGPLFIGLVGTSNGFLGGYNDPSTKEDAFALLRLGMAEASTAPGQWHLMAQTKLGNTAGVINSSSSGGPFAAANGSWYHLRAKFKRLDDKTLQINGALSNADDQGHVGSVVSTFKPVSLSMPDIAGAHQVWVALRGFGASGADVWDDFSIKAYGPEPGVPAAPALKARGLDAYRTSLQWKDSAVNEDSFIVSRATVPGGPYTDLATLAANTTAYIDRTANRTIANYYQVRAVSAAGSAPSGEVDVPPHESPYRWENVSIGGGGFVTGLFVHPLAPHLIYLRTDQGGFYRWNADQSRWVAIMDHLTMSERQWYGGEGLALDPQNPDIVYVACGRFAGPNDGPGALFKSTDRGVNWTKLPLEGVKMGARDSKRGSGERLVVSPHD